MSTKRKAKMKLLGFLVLVSMVAKSQTLLCTSNFRRPVYDDISVICGTSSISLAIIVCPVIYTGYNESLLFLNNVDKPECKGTLDESASPPVVRFSFALNKTNACGSKFWTTSAPGTGILSDISNMQTVNVSGLVLSFDPTTGMVTYNAELKYYYSCAYPLEYFVNNTQVDVSSSSIALTGKNGSFISTLDMKLYSDIDYLNPLVIPSNGLDLRTEIFVEVKASNLTAQYNVHLDQCYASVSPYPANSSIFNFFVSCNQDRMTSMIENGDSHSSRFSFTAFRFIEQQNETVSTYYIHCITRLCSITSCDVFKCAASERRRRDVSASDVSASDVSEATTLSSNFPIVTKNEDPLIPMNEVSSAHSSSGSTVGLGVATGILSVVVVAAVGAAVVFYRRLRH